MWKFSKESGVDVLDLPELHRRKLINLPEQDELDGKEITKDGFFDLSTNSQISSNQEEQNNTQVTDFLSDFASIGATQPNTNNSQPTESQYKSDNSESVHFKDLKWRIENLEFKLEQLIEKMNSQNQKIDAPTQLKNFNSLSKN